MNDFDHVDWRRKATADARAVKRELDRTIATAAELTGLLMNSGGDIRLVIGIMLLAADQLQDPSYREVVLDRFETYAAPIRPVSASAADSEFAGPRFAGRLDPSTAGITAQDAVSPEDVVQVTAAGQIYEAARVTRPGGGVALQDLLHSPELDACLIAIVEQEGGMHADTIVERLCETFDQARVTGDTREGITADLARLVGVDRLVAEAAFFDIPNRPVQPRDRSTCVPALRSARRLPPAEIRAAIEVRLKAGPASRSQVAIASAAMLGMPLTTTRLSSTLLGQAITQALRDLDKLGRICVAKDGSLALADCAQVDEAACDPDPDPEAEGAPSDAASSTELPTASDGQSAEPEEACGEANGRYPEIEEAPSDTRGRMVPHGASNVQASSGL